MSILDDFKNMLGLGPKDLRSVEDKLADLKQQAEDAEKLAAQTKEAWDYRKRIATAGAERQRVLMQSRATAKKGLTSLQLGVIVVLAVIFLILIFKSCG